MTAVLLQTAYIELDAALASAVIAGARGVAFIALEDAEKQNNALVDVASDMDGLWFAGAPAAAGQPMAFPRAGALPDALMRLAKANIEEAMARASSYSGEDGASDSPSASAVHGSLIEDTQGPLTKKYAAVASVVVDVSLARFCDRARNQLLPLLASQLTKVPVAYSGSGSARRVY
jgi:hypothetical protein